MLYENVLFISNGSFLDSRKDTFATLGPAMMVCQSAAILEVLHPLVGWVKTGVAATLMQVLK